MFWYECCVIIKSELRTEREQNARAYFTRNTLYLIEWDGTIFCLNVLLRLKVHVEQITRLRKDN